MREILEDLTRWRSEGKRAVIGRVTGVDGSGPRAPGAAMAVSEDGQVVGSVSGGCVEGAVVERGLQLLADESEPALLTFGYSDDEAFAVGLTCGGTIHIFLERMDGWDPSTEGRMLEELHQAVGSGQPVSLATVVEGADTGRKLLVRPNAPPLGSLGDSDLDRVAARDALAELEVGRSGRRHYGLHGEARQEDVTVFFDSYAAPPRMIIFGAVDFTAALARFAKLLGYHVVVCDAREVFATPQRFPMADEVVVAWPQRLLEEIGKELGPLDAVCVLTHDPKFDVPAITESLRTNVGYIGAMGSRRTHAKRVERLKQEGVSDEELTRVLAPIGLDIGARTPEETAISIVGEIIGRHTGRLGVASLQGTQGRIHAS
jgi:xanthine dehydrogenase accessory factor